MIAQSMLVQVTPGEAFAANENLQRGLHEPGRNACGLQTAVLSMRMRPISSVFSWLPGLVCDLASKLNKQVEIKLIGELTGLDKSFIEKISGSLMYLIRNSMDHGIEMPDERIVAGKNPRATVTLRAYHQCDNIVIEVSDDGGGLNRTKILKRARERGMVLRDEMSDREIYALIMKPGFSNAGEVTDISGCAIGMAAVSRNIAELGGHIELDSVEGRGSRVTLRLPLMPATLDGWSVLVGGETYIVPLSAIIEFIPGNTARFKTVAGGHLLSAQDEDIPVIAMHRIFNIHTAITTPEHGILIVLEAWGRKVALLVDELLAQHQVVLKNLETNFRKVSCISGATIMGNGLVVFILDAGALVRYGHVATFTA